MQYTGGGVVDKFPCTQCGACCRRVHRIPFFKYADKTHGGCTKLVNNKCSIYEERPTVCSIDKMRSLMRPYIDKMRDYRETAVICNKMIADDKLDKKYLVNMSIFEDQ